MEYRITTLKPKILIGKNNVMSFAMDKTKELWQSFMPERDKVINRTDENYYSMQIYPKSFSFQTFDPTKEFTKWAAVEVEHADNVAHGMNKYLLQGGLYAVFIHRGPASEFSKAYTFIFSQWLPSSGYELDYREHFEVLPKDYNPTDSNATEEIWVPIKKLERG